jgi:hypothetical protein
MKRPCHFKVLGPASAILLISSAGLLTAAWLALAPGEAGDGHALRKPLVGWLFISICVLGMVAVLRPGPCSRAVGFRPRDGRAPGGKEGRTVSAWGTVGHHPDCEGFSSHVLRVRGREVCAGCTGLFIGGLVALSLTASYFLGGVASLGSPMALVAGLAGVSFALLVPALGCPYPWARLLSSASLAVGSFLVLAAVDAARKDLCADLLVIGIVVYWIMGRIMLSRLSHGLICSECADPLCTPGTASPSS